ncbi:hypothetical protein K1T71_000695 [Dendrolimus kikuchii]|uniref:Uncharacterized protein n=1 Tax=Dendrolimus kikuchii TaxID=765133 RepID=A0ACC1DKR6_9NEOP|nr:hypothetical protein K1T71_000695 [Dendrolimus kikuchii]
MDIVQNQSTTTNNMNNELSSTSSEDNDQISRINRYYKRYEATSDNEVEVRKPIQNRFTIYKLKVEDDKRDQSWLVFRRYTDFVRLYSRIKAENPTLILPLPGKRWFRDNFEPAFLEERVRGLQVFVNAILCKLPNHPVVREFFCLDEPPQVFSYQPEVQAVYGALEDSITSLRMQVKQKDATILHLQKRLNQLEVQLNSCENCSERIRNGSM